MPKLFLTSSPFAAPGAPLNGKNCFAVRFAACVRGMRRALFITSDPAHVRFTESFSDAVRLTMELTGIRFPDYTILDGRNRERAAELVQSAELIILAGGHVPTQNAFFAEIGLRAMMRQFDGTVLGISAGSMNAADIVYAQPEEEGEAVDPAYQRFLTGLDLTKTMLIPHYQAIRDDMLDGMRIVADITCPDSFGRRFIALCDGSYLYADSGCERIFGEAYLIQDGVIRQLSADADDPEGVLL